MNCFVKLSRWAKASPFPLRISNVYNSYCSCPGFLENKYVHYSQCIVLLYLQSVETSFQRSSHPGEGARNTTHSRTSGRTFSNTMSLQMKTDRRKCQLSFIHASLFISM